MSFERCDRGVSDSIFRSNRLLESIHQLQRLPVVHQTEYVTGPSMGVHRILSCSGHSKNGGPHESFHDFLSVRWLERTEVSCIGEQTEVKPHITIVGSGSELQGARH